MPLAHPTKSKKQTAQPRVYHQRVTYKQLKSAFLGSFRGAGFTASVKRRFENPDSSNPLATKCSSCLIAADGCKGTVPHFSANRRAADPSRACTGDRLAFTGAAACDQDRRGFRRNQHADRHHRRVEGSPPKGDHFLDALRATIDTDAVGYLRR
jgi:hypothetical protein